jgi:hypothetical protein
MYLHYVLTFDHAESWFEFLETYKFGGELVSLLEFGSATVVCFNYRCEAERLTNASLSICLSVCLSIYLSIIYIYILYCVCVCVCVCVCMCVCVYMPTYIHTYTYIHIPIYL